MSAPLYPTGDLAVSAVLVIPGVAAALLALVASYRLGARLNVAASALTLIAASSLVIARPSPSTVPQRR